MLDEELSSFPLDTPLKVVFHTEAFLPTSNYISLTGLAGFSPFLTAIWGSQAWIMVGWPFGCHHWLYLDSNRHLIIQESYILTCRSWKSVMIDQWDSSLSVLSVAQVQFPIMAEYLEELFPRLITLYESQPQPPRGVDWAMVLPANWCNGCNQDRPSKPLVKLEHAITTQRNTNGETSLREVGEQQLYCDSAARRNLCVSRTPHWQARAYLESDQ